MLAGVSSLINIPSVFFPTPDGDEGPPLAILVGQLGARHHRARRRRHRVASGNRAAIRVAAGALILNALTSLPAFFVDVPAGLKLSSGVSVLLTVLRSC